jgi:hypothetical protein
VGWPHNCAALRQTLTGPALPPVRDTIQDDPLFFCSAGCILTLAGSVATASLAAIAGSPVSTGLLANPVASSRCATRRPSTAGRGILRRRGSLRAGACLPGRHRGRARPARLLLGASNLRHNLSGPSQDRLGNNQAQCSRSGQVNAEVDHLPLLNG